MDPEPSYLSFADLIDLLDVREQSVTLPGWPKPLRVRPLTVAEASEIRRDATTGATVDNDRASQLMILKCLVVPALTDAQVRLLWTKAAGKVGALLSFLNQLNGFGDADAQATQADAREAAFRAES